jgi:hypothetical protein
MLEAFMADPVDHVRSAYAWPSERPRKDKQWLKRESDGISWELLAKMNLYYRPS